MGDEEVTSQDWVVGCSIRVLTKHTKEVRGASSRYQLLAHTQQQGSLGVMLNTTTTSVTADGASSSTPPAQQEQHQHQRCARGQLYLLKQHA
jgi:hypothetical protein